MPTFRAAIRVRPGARADRVGGASPSARADASALVVAVRARPVRGAATRAAEEVLAATLGVRAWQVRVVRGATSREKLVEITDPPADIDRRWATLLAPPG